MTTNLFWMTKPIMLTLTPLFFPRWGDYILGTDFGNTIDPEVGLWDNRSREVLEKLSHRPISNENAGVKVYSFFLSKEEALGRLITILMFVMHCSNQDLSMAGVLNDKSR
ncbi:MAG: hypothetical protein H6633_17710 [Anaerolineales bacterium]|nr:hypothetical protein [Anaerolineales bacterium]